MAGGKPPPEWYIRQGGDYNDVLKYLDLHEIAAEIDSKCKIFEILENLNSELVFTSEKATFRRCNTRRRKPL